MNIYFCPGINIIHIFFLLCSGSDWFEGMKREKCVCEWESECSSLLFILLSRLSIFYYRTQGRLFDVCVRKKRKQAGLSLAGLRLFYRTLSGNRELGTDVEWTVIEAKHSHKKSLWKRHWVPLQTRPCHALANSFLFEKCSTRLYFSSFLPFDRRACV